MAAVPPTDRLFRLPRVGQRDVSFTLPRIWFFVFFPGHAKRRGPIGGKAVAALYGERGRGRGVLGLGILRRSESGCLLEAPRRVPSRDRGPSRPGLSLRCARQRRSTRGAFGHSPRFRRQVAA